MIKNARKVMKNRVYSQKTGDYLGKISDIAFMDNKISGYIMKTESIIPLDVWICPASISKTKRGKMYVNANVIGMEENYISFKNNAKGKTVNLPDGTRKIRDMHFDEETGEILDFVCIENIFRPKEKIPANKIQLSWED